MKLGNYAPSIDDVIKYSCNVLIVDDQISTHSSTFPISTSVNFNTGSVVNSATQSIQIVRTGSEVPVLNLTAAILNATNIVYNSKFDILNYSTIVFV